MELIPTQTFRIIENTDLHGHVIYYVIQQEHLAQGSFGRVSSKWITLQRHRNEENANTSLEQLNNKTAHWLKG